MTLYFLTIVKVFDRVGREAIDDAFSCLVFGRKYRLLHKGLYSKISAQISTYHGLSESIPCNDRLPQGDGDSPSTFTEIMEMLLVWLESENLIYAFPYLKNDNVYHTKAQA